MIENTIGTLENELQAEKYVMGSCWRDHLPPYIGDDELDTCFTLEEIRKMEMERPAKFVPDQRRRAMAAAKLDKIYRTHDDPNVRQTAGNAMARYYMPNTLFWRIISWMLAEHNI